MYEITTVLLNRLIDTALEEDLAQGDITTHMLIDPREEGSAHVVARQDLVLCGREIFERTMNRVDPYLSITHRFADGALVPKGSIVTTVTGPAVSILTGERTSLNFLSHLSGIATLTRRYVDELPKGAKTKITDTRKTLPGLRTVEKYAVRCGGGINHRANLSSAILIKDNHIAMMGSVAKAVAKAREAIDPSHRIEVEVSSLEQVSEALSAGAEVIMLDNMTHRDMAAAVKAVAGRALLEVSGKVRIENVASLARTGVDFISVGALTHSAPSVDFSMEMAARHAR